MFFNHHTYILGIKNFVIKFKFSILRFALKNDLPLLEYCTLPRTGALEVIMQVIGPEKKDMDKQKSLEGNNSKTKAESSENEINETQTKLNSTNIVGTETGTSSSQDSQEIVTNNNQTKWNTQQYFR